MSKKRKSKTPVMLTVLVILLAMFFVFSRTHRFASRNLRIAEIPEKKPTTDSILKPQTDQHSQNLIPMKNLPDKSILLGQLSAEQSDSLLVPVDQRYANRTGMYMHKEAYESFLKMHQAAATEGIQLTIVSAFRSFAHQKRIWENKWNGRQVLSGNIWATDINDPLERAREILRFSAMPGTSRHHWGTDIDINSLQNSYFESGRGKREYDWLVANAHKYGFCQPYTARGNRNHKGYEEEKWHWSYLPVAHLYLQTFIEQISDKDIAGFDGWQTAQELEVIRHYVKPIDPNCLDYPW